MQSITCQSVEGNQYAPSPPYALNTPETPITKFLDSQITTQTNTPLQGSRKIKKQKDSFPRINNGHWTKEEHEIYVNFLMQHKQETISKQQAKKNNKIFKLMAQTIGTRSPSQCRSHHQKFNPFTPQGQRRSMVGRKRITNNEKINPQRQLQFQESGEISTCTPLTLTPTQPVGAFQFSNQNSDYLFSSELPQPPQLLLTNYSPYLERHPQELEENFLDNLFKPTNDYLYTIQPEFYGYQ